MRNKAFLLTAALGAFCADSAMAQVYSVNAVGYINVTAPKGFSMIANQLDAGAGNNTVGKLFAGVPDGTTLYKYTGTGYVINGYSEVLGDWDDPAMTLVPGEGAWINNPTQAAITITFVGEVKQGALVNSIPAGFAIRSSIVPQSGQLDTVLGFPAAEGDTVYFYRNGSYQISAYSDALGEWDTPPVPAVGESFWTKVSAAKDWNRQFSVNN